MKVKEKGKKRQTEEQAKMTEPPFENTTASSTMTAKTEQGRMIIIEHVADVSKGDKLKTEQKADDELRGMQVVQVEVHRNLEPSDIVNVDTGESENESESAHQETNEEDQPVVEFEDQAYKLTQTYQLKQEYHEMTLEQEAEAVQALTPLEQAEHWELTMLHRRQAEMEKEIMGLSHIVKERVKAKAPSLPINLVQRSVRTEAPERQELHKLMETQCTWVMTNHDDTKNRKTWNMKWVLFVCR